MNQQEFAALIGVARAYISMLEAGKCTPSRHFLLAVEYVHGIRAWWLTSGEAPIWRGAIPAAGPAR